MPTRGGVVVKHGETLHFLPASAVVRIAPCPPISRVPGAPKSLLGIAHTGGEIVPVVAITDAPQTQTRTPLIVCRYLGEPVGIIGCDVVKAGMFDAEGDDGAIMFEGVRTDALDLAVTFANLQSAPWAVRWEG